MNILPEPPKHAEPANAAVPMSSSADPVLEELWRVKDARAARFENADNLLKYLQNKYGLVDLTH